MARYVPLILFGGGDASQWVQKYPVEGNGIPKFYVVRADGEMLHGQLGGPPDVDEFLKEQLKKAGTPLSDSDVERLDASLASAKEALDKDDVTTAIKVLSTAPGKGSFARGVNEAKELVEAILKKADDDIARAEELVSDKDNIFEGAMLIAEASTKYAKITSKKRQIGTVMRKYSLDADGAKALEQANSFLRAKSRENASNKDLAITGYQSIISQYPDTEVARMASQRLEALGAEVAASSSPTAIQPVSITAAGDKMRTWTTSDGKFSVRAEFVIANDTLVRLKKEDGLFINVPLAKLSDADVQYVRENR
jgi:hypothetical protein